MQTIRLNGLAMIHKALRAMMYDTAMAMQHTHFADAGATLPVLDKVSGILEIFEDHAQHEDTIISPATTKHNPGLAAELEHEHVRDHQLCEDLRRDIADYNTAATDVERIHAGNKVFYKFNEFIAFNLIHMNKEETVMNETLWANYTDAEIMAFNQKIAASIAPLIAIQNIKWMMRAANNTEIIQFINGLRPTALPPLFNILLQNAQNELPGHRWEHVKQHIEETVPA